MSSHHIIIFCWNNFLSTPDKTDTFLRYFGNSSLGFWVFHLSVFLKIILGVVSLIQQRRKNDRLGIFYLWPCHNSVITVVLFYSITPQRRLYRRVLLVCPQLQCFSLSVIGLVFFPCDSSWQGR